MNIHTRVRPGVLALVLVAVLSGLARAQDDVVSFGATSSSARNVLAWRNPVNPPYGSTRLIGRTDHFPSDENDIAGAFVVNKTGVLGGTDSVPHDGLLADTTYFYGVFVEDGASSYSAGRFVSVDLVPASGPVKWRFTPADSAVSMTPPGIGAHILFPNNNGFVYALERGPDGGTWPAGVHPAFVGSPVQHRPPVISLAGVMAADRFTLLSSQDGFVRAVDADSGEPVWASEDLGVLQAGPGAWLAGFGAGADFVLVGTRNDLEDNILVALHANDGSEAWRFDDANGTRVGIVNGGPSIDYFRSKVYFACHERTTGADTVYALDLATGGKVWSAGIGSVSGSPILRGDVLYVAADNGDVYGFDADNGSETLNFPFATGDGLAKGFVFPDFGGTKQELYLATQTTVWKLRDVGPVINKRWSHPGIPGPSIVLYPPGSQFLWLGSSDGRLYQLDVTTGNPSQPPSTKSIVLGNGNAGVGAPSFDVFYGLLYVGTEDGSLYAVDVPF